jgi:hypothetical protein
MALYYFRCPVEKVPQSRSLGAAVLSVSERSSGKRFWLGCMFPKQKGILLCSTRKRKLSGIYKNIGLEIADGTIMNLRRRYIAGKIYLKIQIRIHITKKIVRVRHMKKPPLLPTERAPSNYKSGFVSNSQL